MVVLLKSEAALGLYYSLKIHMRPGFKPIYSYLYNQNLKLC